MSVEAEPATMFPSSRHVQIGPWTAGATGTPWTFGVAVILAMQPRWMTPLNSAQTEFKTGSTLIESITGTRFGETDAGAAEPAAPPWETVCVGVTTVSQEMTVAKRAKAASFIAADLRDGGRAPKDRGRTAAAQGGPSMTPPPGSSPHRPAGSRRS